MIKNIVNRLVSRSVGASVAVVLMATGAFAEPLDYFLIEGTDYDQTVAKPAEVFGHDIGDQPIRHDLMVAYIRELASASPRMVVETIGYSHERRPILFITVSSPENLARLEEIRQNHLLRSNPETASQASDDLPVVTWLNYGVHGAESSGMDAAVPALYHLASARGDKINDTLENSVILITAIFNPDGHARRGAWVTQYGSDVRATDPEHEVHKQIWPGGRTNHYWFDLNRQWLLQTQPESRAWLTQWHKWKPQVSADFHEMGPNSTYYFHPGVPTRKYPLIPTRGRELLVELADYHQQTLDREKSLYFSEEGFDNYYIGKGSTYPQVNGSLGVLFEAGAQMGIARESDQGIKTYANNIRNHLLTSLSTIEGAAAMRASLHAYQREFYETAMEAAKHDDVSGYVFQAPEDPVRLHKFIELLGRHDVKAYALNGSLRADGRIFGEGAFVVPMNQRQYRMAKALFNRITEFPDKVFYDVSGWTLPLAYGLDYAELKGSLRGKIGDEAPDAYKVAAEPQEAPYAYVFRWSDYYAPRAVSRLLEAGVMARVSKEPIRVQTTSGVISFDRGAIIVQRDLQTVPANDIHALMKEIAADNDLIIHAATSGHTLDAGADLGGRNSVTDLKPIKPLLVVGGKMSPYDAGEVWHLLDHRMNMPVTLVRQDRLKSIDMRRYTHLILVGGRGDVLPKDMADDLKAWVKGGGTIIASRQGADWAAKYITGNGKKDEKDENKDDAVPARLAYADKGQKDAEHVIGGALFESDLDITHPMGFGLVRRMMASNKNTATKLPVPKDPYAQVAVYTESPLLSGYASERRISELKGTPMMTAERMGEGAIILFADNPNFRATYLGTEKLFLNALFFSTAFDRSYADEADEQAVEE
ncbi:M14 family zinc carboxypeptidase [Kordiimonas lipolytica]|uniref:M14 family zinc carboxypeptidase n=1 Tax=Kordiimonas lipolytica TaxID=1662421 RepID=A0ABV8UES4_9PROT|nr:M14 family zinc carboxypeptidase [Kordiimonas lipolytica]